MVKYLQVLFVFLAFTKLHAYDVESKRLEECSYVIDSVLTKYDRPFTLLGIGQNTGKCIEKSALAYPTSVFVIFDKTPGNNNYLSFFTNTVWLNHKILFKEVLDFSSCEHVDILLLCNVLDTFHEKWKEAFLAFQQMAHVIVVEVPKKFPVTVESVSLGEMHQYLSQLSKGGGHEGVSSVYYTIEGGNFSRLIRTTLIHPRKTRWDYEIYCDYNQKFLKKIRPNWTSMSPWTPGINLMTYLMFNGSIPSRSQVLNSIPIDEEHSDWVPNNMIIQGKKIILIDKEDPVSTPVTLDGGKRFDDLEVKLKKFILRTRNMSPQQVREAFISIYNWGNYFDQTEIEE